MNIITITDCNHAIGLRTKMFTIFLEKKPIKILIIQHSKDKNRNEHTSNLSLIFSFKEPDGLRTNNGIHYRLSLYYPASEKMKKQSKKQNLTNLFY